MAVRTRTYHFDITTSEIIDHIPPKRQLPIKKVIEGSENKKTVIALPRLRCPYCFHEWIPRSPEPKKCPNCHNVIWRLWHLLETKRENPSYNGAEVLVNQGEFGQRDGNG
jgi:hypothetical protein